MLKQTNTNHARQFIEMISATTQDECREMGEQMLALASNPRDHQWKMMMQLALEAIPAPPATDLASKIFAARARSAAETEKLRESGWHPDQMREKLLELGYAGIAPTDAG